MDGMNNARCEALCHESNDREGDQCKILTDNCMVSLYLESPSQAFQSTMSVDMQGYDNEAWRDHMARVKETLNQSNRDHGDAMKGPSYPSGTT